MSESPVIPVHCPHCGASFAIDPDQETLMAAPAPGGRPEPGTPMAFRPVCPKCQRRVVVVQT